MRNIPSKVFLLQLFSNSHLLPIQTRLDNTHHLKEIKIEHKRRGQQGLEWKRREEMREKWKALEKRREEERRGEERREQNKTKPNKIEKNRTEESRYNITVITIRLDVHCKGIELST
jgi:hypothetical protein